MLPHRKEQACTTMTEEGKKKDLLLQMREMGMADR